MIYTFTFEGNTPSKKNQKQLAYNKKAGRTFIVASESYKIWNRQALQAVQLQARAFPPKSFPIPVCRRIALTIYFGDLRRRDSSNLWESVADLLVDAGILEDDRWAVTGPTAQIPVLRKGRPGWVVDIETDKPELAVSSIQPKEAR